MSLAPGARLGPYEIVAAIGSGGMGDVYRARDSKLQRDVAIKVLPDVFARDPDRLARFEREAQTLAALNHPNIAHVYGVIESPPGLVMELVEGEDLAARLMRGHIPVDETLAIARQIADAFEAAHEQGIVHRDLKPANVKLRPDGAVKVLDFGLAKAFAPPESALPGGPPGLADSPTFTSPVATQAGMIMGTAAYMAPEQARGKRADRRADVWAFGVVLYEMLTGRRAFEGTETSDVLASVLKDTPALDALPSDTPLPVRRLLRRCLEKDRAKRLDSMAAARMDIDDALHPETSRPDAAPVRLRSRGVRMLPLIALPVIAVLIASWLGVTRPWTTADSPRVQRFGVDPAGDGLAVDDVLQSAMALSPDGTTFVFAGHNLKDAQTKLFARRLDTLVPVPLAGTEDAEDPFFSPDGQWLAFFARGALWKMSMNGGAAVRLADVQIDRGGWWGEDNVISYAPTAVVGGRIMRVPAAGATPVPLGPMVKGSLTQRWPQALPGDRAVIYTGSSAINNFDDGCLVVQTLDGAPPRTLQCGGSFWRYVAGGYVLFVHGSTLSAVPFDVKHLSVSGPPVRIVDDMRSAPTSGVAQFTVANSGLLVYLAGKVTSANATIETIDRAGKIASLGAPPVNWQTLAYSPDGRSIAMCVSGSDGWDIWIYDIARDTLTRLTFGKVTGFGPVWTPDGKRIVYAAAQQGPPNLFWVAADGTGEPQRLTTSSLVQVPSSWSPDGKYLAFTQQSDLNNADVYLLPMESDGRNGWKPGQLVPYLTTPADERYPAFSPDGRWIAYASDESGKNEIYVRAFSGTGGKWQVSVDGGLWPVWSSNAKELLFGTIDGHVMSVHYDVSGGAFRSSRPEVWTPTTFVPRGASIPFTLSPDGTHIATSSVPSAPSSQRIVFVTNFFEELRAKFRDR